MSNPNLRIATNSLFSNFLGSYCILANNNNTALYVNSLALDLNSASDWADLSMSSVCISSKYAFLRISQLYFFFHSVIVSLLTSTALAISLIDFPSKNKSNA